MQHNRGRLGDVYGILYFLNHIFKDADLTGLLIEFGTFRSSLSGDKNFVYRNRYKLYNGNHSGNIQKKTITAQGFDLEDIFADAMGKLSNEIMQKNHC